MKLYVLLAAALTLVGCATTSEAAPPMKYCSDTKTYVKRNAVCPAPAPAPTTTTTTSTTTTTTTADPVITPTETTVPTTPTEPTASTTVEETGWVPSPSLDGLPDIDDGLDVTALTNDISKYPHTDGEAAPDVVGAFRMDCQPGQVNKDDPLVFPGQPGKSHPHGWYGNTEGNAFSTFASMRTQGDSTCLNPLNRSNYWAPAMMDPVRNVVYRVDHTKLYYKRRPKSDIYCSKSTSPYAEGECIPHPSGIRYIFGYDFLTGKTPPDSFYWMCSSGTFSGATVGPVGGDSGHKTNLEDAMLVCPVGARVSAALKAPDCWDGKNLDSPNHRDHMAYKFRNVKGIMECPADHPFVIPGITLMQVWNVTQALKASSDAGNLGVSSDFMVGSMKKGSTYHGDFFFGWNRPVYLTFVHNCIDRLLNCSSGDLGNGRQLKNLSSTKFPSAPQEVPMP